MRQAPELISVLQEANQEVNPQLQEMANIAKTESGYRVRGRGGAGRSSAYHYHQHQQQQQLFGNGYGRGGGAPRVSARGRVQKAGAAVFASAQHALEHLSRGAGMGGAMYVGVGPARAGAGAGVSSVGGAYAGKNGYGSNLVGGYGKPLVGGAVAPLMSSAGAGYSSGFYNSQLPPPGYMHHQYSLMH